jgi:hypothetical protein
MPGVGGQADEKLVKGSLVIHHDQALALFQLRAFYDLDVIFQGRPQEECRRKQSDYQFVAGQDPFFCFGFCLGLHISTSQINMV